MTFPGVGPARRKALNEENLNPLKELGKLQWNSLVSVDTISEKVAKDIYTIFH